MSRVSISRSYAILVGLESYTHARKLIETAEQKVRHKKDELVHPEKIRLEEGAKQDKSESAEKERLYLAQQHDGQERELREQKPPKGLIGKLSRILGSVPSRGRAVAQKEDEPKGYSGTGPEDGTPAPEGQR